MWSATEDRPTSEGSVGVARHRRQLTAETRRGDGSRAGIGETGFGSAADRDRASGDPAVGDGRLRAVSPGGPTAGPITRRRLLQGAGGTAVALGVGGVWPDRFACPGGSGALEWWSWGPASPGSGARTGCGASTRSAPRCTSGQSDRAAESRRCAATSTTASWSRSTPSSSTPSTPRRWRWRAICA